MGREEQAEEREVLDSIFPDEITNISDTEFRIAVTVNPPEAEDEDAEAAAAPPPTLFLHVRYPAGYPDEAPELDLSAPAGAPPHPRLSLAADKAALLAALDEPVRENLGMAMVFTLVAALGEAAEGLMAERRGRAAAAREEVRLAAEREENAKFHGEAVTPASFRAWRDAFVREMAELAAAEELRAQQEAAGGRGGSKGGAGKDEKKLTGRQLWERGLAGRVDEGDDDEPPAEAVARLKVEA
ncbi:RWD-domain-containing protein [Xylariaceae sp. FL0804]|nr:RWD-domain-containing protein [Xylariaceae sp. FL0804]